MMPLAAFSQVAPDRAPRPAADRTYKYMVYAGPAYTSLNQVNQSRYGLIGADLEVSREFGRFFAITADGAFYSTSAGGGNPTPNISFAGGAGAGVEYAFGPRWVIRASGDDIAASFSVNNNTSAHSYSPHTTRSARASIGVGYRF